MQVGRGFRNPKAHMIRRQFIAEAHHDRFPIPRMEGRAGIDAVEAPNLARRQVGVEAVICLALMYLIKLLWEKLLPALMRGAGSLPGNRVDVRCRNECLYRLGHRRNRKFSHKWWGWRASAPV